MYTSADAPQVLRNVGCISRDKSVVCLLQPIDSPTDAVGARDVTVIASVT
jgi:hypothetical protein